MIQLASLEKLLLEAGVSLGFRLAKPQKQSPRAVGSLRQQFPRVQNLCGSSGLGFQVNCALTAGLGVL